MGSCKAKALPYVLPEIASFCYADLAMTPRRGARLDFALEMKIYFS
jgi:hypothetical protein